MNRRHWLKLLDEMTDAVILLFLLMQGKIYRMGEKMSAWRYVQKAGGENWNSVIMQRNLLKENAYLSKTLMQWVEKNKGLTEYSEKRCREDFGLALRMFIKKPNGDNLRFLKDMYDYGITHVVKKDQRTTLFGYSIATIVKKLFGGKQ